MNTTSKVQQDNSKALHFCSRMNKTVDTHQTLEECIGANECFSDDPCPLSGQFKESSAHNLRENSDPIKS